MSPPPTTSTRRRGLLQWNALELITSSLPGMSGSCGQPRGDQDVYPAL